MNVFYNREGVGDTLLIAVGFNQPEEVTYEKKGDVVKIIDEKSKEVVGFNIFNASTYFSNLDQAKGNVALTEDLLKQINQTIKDSGFEDELNADFSPKFVIGYVEEKEKHPNADKLSICKVNVGTETLQIVCGAPNVDAGQKVVVAKIGSVMPSGLVIKPSELRGVASSGMICSAKELELPNAPQEKGILVLEDHYEVGQEFKF